MDLSSISGVAPSLFVTAVDTGVNAVWNGLAQGWCGAWSFVNLTSVGGVASSLLVTTIYASVDAVWNGLTEGWSS